MSNPNLARLERLIALGGSRSKRASAKWLAGGWKKEEGFMETKEAMDQLGRERGGQSGKELERVMKELGVDANERA